MKRIPLLTILLLSLLFNTLQAQSPRQDVLLEKNWQFCKGENFDAAKAETVTVPHDWAIYGPFDMKADEQNVAIAENFETKASVKTGRTGALPFVGVGWYRTTFDVVSGSPNQSVTLLFDGAMSEPQVSVNGKPAGEWKYGYNAFFLDITNLINKDGKNNELLVRLENHPDSARWYPGAGLYRNVHVITANEVHVPVWGTYITTPFVSEEYASVRLKINLKNVADEELVRLETFILDADGKTAASKNDIRRQHHGDPLEQNFTVPNPKLWSPESPNLYRAVTKVYVQDKLVDEYTTRFGIRDIQYIADKGFFLNGKLRKFKGVCNHHDLGPLGAAINTAALRRQLTLLKEMGCDSIRTSHNMPAAELVQLCDEMGLMMMVESFDEWERRKCQNGYNRFFNDWAEKDMVNMLHQFRNNPSVVMWSIGNEVPTQTSSEGYKVARFLQEICHREDPTRPVTCGMDNVANDLKNGFAAVLDIPGLNYRTSFYEEAYKTLPHNIVLGSETASTVSSRGVYKFPVVFKKLGQNKSENYPDFQCSSYDFEACFWSNIPDVDFALADDYGWEIGQFVWTGFDYLGEPTPYDSNQTPNHSSMFGIIDLAGIPKDRFYLYRSVWKTEAETLHIVPHWNWEGREGEITPVFVYTNYPSAELFINGKSQGKQTKSTVPFSFKEEDVTKRYRLMWMKTKYEPGELKVVAYDASGKKAAEKAIKTAGQPARIELTPDRQTLTADGKDLSYINVRIIDKDGNFCPNDQRLVKFTATGSGKYRAAANGDPTSMEIFHLPQMHVFYGQLTAIVQAGESAGEIEFKVEAEGIEPGTIKIAVK